jgi:hypothetical protein
MISSWLSFPRSTLFHRHLRRIVTEVHIPFFLVLVGFDELGDIVRVVSDQTVVLESRDRQLAGSLSATAQQFADFRRAEK